MCFVLCHKILYWTVSVLYFSLLCTVYMFFAVGTFCFFIYLGLVCFFHVNMFCGVSIFFNVSIL